MKTINVTKNKTINLPNAFTMKELMAANPNVKKETLYQRIQAMLKKGDESPIKIVDTVKRGKKVEGSKTPVNGRGRTEIVYALKDASEGNNLIRQAKAQGIARAKKQGLKQGVSVNVTSDKSDATEVPVITDVAPLPDSTVPATV